MLNNTRPLVNRRSGPPPRPPGLPPRVAPAQQDPDIYGLLYADGLPGFPGLVASSCRGPAAEYVAAVCDAGMAEFQERHSHSQELVPKVETALRRIAQQLTPSSPDLDARCAVMDRLRALAQSGVAFSLGLDLEPYGSFVSGLYTPRGDLDLSIEGTAMWTGEDGKVQRLGVHDMDREQQQRFLRALANRVEKGGLARGRVERVLHARVPILKFREASLGLECDVGICAGIALFKSAVLGLLAQYDWRVGALVRLVKAWARRCQINDSANGTLNSFALTLMVIFHLQTRSPPVLPALCELFAGPYSHDAARPMEAGTLPNFELLKRGATYLSTLSRQGGHGNNETLVELLASFFAFGSALTGNGAWGHRNLPVARVLRRARLNTWAGQLREGQWDRSGYFCSVEDPFDTSDNCARTVRRQADFDKIAGAFSAAAARLRNLSNEQAAEAALQNLFGPELTRAVALRPLLDSPSHAAISWIKPTDLIMPPRLRHHVEDQVPRTVRVNHRQRRGQEEGSLLPPWQNGEELEGLGQQLQQMEIYLTEEAVASQGIPTGNSGSGSSNGSGSGSSNGSGSGSSNGSATGAKAAAPAPAAGLLEALWQQLAPQIAEETAKQAEEDAREMEAEAGRQARKELKRSARRAAAEAKQAAQRALRAEKQKERAERRASGTAGAAAGAQVPGPAGSSGGQEDCANADARASEQQQQQEGREQAAAAACDIDGEQQEGGGRPRQRSGPKRNFGMIMKQLSALEGSEAAWAAAFASLPPHERGLLQSKGVGGYAAFVENQRRFRHLQQRVAAAKAAAPPPGAAAAPRAPRALPVGPKTTVEAEEAAAALAAAMRHGGHPVSPRGGSRGEAVAAGSDAPARPWQL